MKKVLSLVLVVAVMFTCTAVFAQQETTTATAVQESKYPVGPMQKLGRGMKNTALGWTELPKGIVNQTKETNLIQGLTFGLLKGVAQTLARTVSGVADILTFPFPKYDQPGIPPVLDLPADQPAK